MSDDDWFEKDIDDFVVAKQAGPTKNEWDEVVPDTSQRKAVPAAYMSAEDYGGSYGTTQKFSNTANQANKSRKGGSSSEYIQCIPLTTLISISGLGNPLDVFLEIAWQPKQFVETLIKPNLSAKVNQVLIKILEKLTRLPLNESRNYLIATSIMIQPFWDQTMDTMRELSKSKKIAIDVNLDEMMVSIIRIARFVVLNLDYPLAFMDFFEKVMMDVCVPGKKFYAQNIREMESILNLMKNRDLKKTFDDIYPTLEDLKTVSEMKLKPNIINGKYPDVNHYLDIHLALLKEDFISPLRDGIMQFIENPESEKRNLNLRVCRNVQLHVPKKGEHKKQESVYLDLNPKENNIDAAHLYNSKRFMFGSLLCFTMTSAVDELIVAVVSNRDKECLADGILQVEILKTYNILNSIFGCDLIMFESEVYFEPYHQVYTVLKNYTESNFPLKEYIIDCKTDAEYPEYIPLKKDSKVLYRHEKYVFDIHDLKSWPPHSEQSLDKSQYAAFQAAITRKFCVIQGPPGTGKTHIGLQIVSALLENANAQILIICLTNHALDQFLSGVLRYTTEIVRMGNMSKNESLDQFNIKNLNEEIVDDKRMRTAFFLLKKEYAALIEQLEVAIRGNTETELLKVIEIQAQMRSVSKRLDDMRQVTNYKLIKDKRVIGITTSYAARARSLLGMLKAPIVLIEETGEVLESHVLAALSEDTQHAILIGDHKQLRPSTSVYELAKRYKMDVSLFERMINNGINCFPMAVQHRMRPAFSNLIRTTIYPHLEDAKVVQNYPDVLGVAQNLFFIDHQNHENRSEDETTKKNPHESAFLINLCHYLLLQGYQPHEITILTTYNGQMHQLFNDRKKHSNLSKVRISVVDNFQGEENRIILLSLVRSNDTKTIGYLSLSNRISVALSRAREGFFIIGNMSLLASCCKMWKSIRELLTADGNIGESLALKCQRHGNIVDVKHPNDFNSLKYGGCRVNCDKILECGHLCVSVCHTDGFEHLCDECRN